MPDLKIFPQGNAYDSRPWFFWDDGSNQVGFFVTARTLNFSAGTFTQGLLIGPQGIRTSGMTINSDGLYVGVTQMINSSGVWTGPKPGIEGAQGAQGAVGC